MSEIINYGIIIPKENIEFSYKLNGIISEISASISILLSSYVNGIGLEYLSDTEVKSVSEIYTKMKKLACMYNISEDTLKLNLSTKLEIKKFIQVNSRMRN